MRAVVIYESLTGNTKKVAGHIVTGLEAAGVTATACPVTAVDYDALAQADVVIIGSWTDGIFVVGQRPGRASRLRALPAMKGKRAVVYCTYALDAGKVLEKMTGIVEGLGAEVIGGMTINRRHLASGAQELVDRLLGAVAA